MPPSKEFRVPQDEWICRFIVKGEWDDVLEQPTPGAFKASDRELSVFHPDKVEQLGSRLSELCFDGLDGAGEAYLQVETCIRLGQCISNEFRPEVYWRPDKVHKEWERWKAAHAQIESPGGKSSFPKSYRSLLAENATCLRLPDDG